MSSYILAFFQKYLQGKPQPILESATAAPPEFPDAVFTARPGPARP